MKRILYLFVPALLMACSECECRISNGVPNFRVRTSYSLVPSSKSIFLKDTLMTYYFVSVQQEGVVKEFVGQMDHLELNDNNQRWIRWVQGWDGDPVGPETAGDLGRCLNMCSWSEVQKQNGIHDVRPLLEGMESHKPSR